VILTALAEKPKRRAKDDFKGRRFGAGLTIQAVSWYLRYPGPRCTQEPDAGR
jgi:hypothetical protein